MMRLHTILIAAMLPLCAPAQPKGDVLLFTYFRGNGEAGVCVAASEDGVKFAPLHGDRPVFAPPDWPGQNLTRDASVIYREGVFRMVWTSAWKGRVFGYAESNDLTTWRNVKQVRAFSEALPEEEQPENIWAPEIHWDERAGEYFVLFAATTKRERGDGDGSDNKGDNTSPYDNRMHIVWTKDGRTFTEAQLFFDQGFSSIDAVMHWDAERERWAMVIKDSRNADLRWMPGRNLRLAFTGPNLRRPQFTPASDPIAGDNAPMFTDAKNAMAEGQSLIRYGGEWRLYWDEPAGSGINLATSPDLKTWTQRKDLAMPAGAHHGTAFFAPRAVVEKLRH